MRELNKLLYGRESAFRRQNGKYTGTGNGEKCDMFHDSYIKLKGGAGMGNLNSDEFSKCYAMTWRVFLWVSEKPLKDVHL